MMKSITHVISHLSCSSRATVIRRADCDNNCNNISEDLCDQLISRLRTSKFALQVDEATDVAKEAHLIAYVRYVAENNIIEDILFCNPIPGKATSNEIFNIIDTFLMKTT